MATESAAIWVPDCVAGLVLVAPAVVPSLPVPLPMSVGAALDVFLRLAFSERLAPVMLSQLGDINSSFFENHLIL